MANVSDQAGEVAFPSASADAPCREQLATSYRIAHRARLRNGLLEVVSQLSHPPLRASLLSSSSAYALGLAVLADELAQDGSELSATTGVDDQADHRSHFVGHHPALPDASLIDVGRRNVLAPGRHVIEPLPHSWPAISFLLVADALRAFASSPLGRNSRIELLGLAVCRPLADKPGDPAAMLRALPWDLVTLTDEFRSEVYGLSVLEVAATCCLQAVFHVSEYGVAAVHPHRVSRTFSAELTEPLTKAIHWVNWRSETVDWLCCEDPVNLLIAAGLLDHLSDSQLETMRILTHGWVGTLGELEHAAILFS